MVLPLTHSVQRALPAGYPCSLLLQRTQTPCSKLHLLLSSPSIPFSLFHLCSTYCHNNIYLLAFFCFLQTTSSIVGTCFSLFCSSKGQDSVSHLGATQKISMVEGTSISVTQHHLHRSYHLKMLLNVTQILSTSVSKYSSLLHTHISLYTHRDVHMHHTDCEKLLCYNTADIAKNVKAISSSCI